MIKINKRRTISEVEEEPPSIQSWLRKKTKELSLSEVTSVEIQLKDIKQMKYSKDKYLQSLYHLANHSYTDEDYVLLSRYNKRAMPYIKKVIHAPWLIDKNDIDKKTIQEIEQDYGEWLQKWKKNKEKNEKKLLEYKLYCLQEYLLQRKLKENIKKYSLEKNIK